MNKPLWTEDSRFILVRLLTSMLGVDNKAKSYISSNRSRSLGNKNYIISILQVVEIVRKGRIKTKNNAILRA